MKKTWQVQEAKARFSELLRASAEQGPQIVSLHGKPTAVVVPMAQWQRMQQRTPRSPKDILLAPAPRFDLALPPRGAWKSRPVPGFED
ncbi:MAG: type II toxin-antitoxin system Phd/YefM family antitoxin [Pseudomonas sp.]|uniref:type II toxin-antitoxin system Phd/YefM family antitoxin n=1 Tax=Ottowia sp. TaxID=1898956 RepID=UPI0039E2F740